jgi:hypothetical protein
LANAVALAVAPQLPDAGLGGAVVVAGPPQQCPEPRVPLGDVEGLPEVVVGAGVEAVDALLDVAGVVPPHRR